MRWTLDMTTGGGEARPSYPYCCFSVDIDGYQVREIDLHDTYPYCCFPVDLKEYRALTAARSAKAPVMIRVEEYEREAVLLRLTQQGLASFKFVGEPRRATHA